ncbi:MAG: fluoride efflux transporter CrcB [Betaproteobacteria bacterium]|jgi:CrcB protein|nr:MAG: fluoride efflux transporter CrcB [Betaproteobacteria bacterium]
MPYTGFLAVGVGAALGAWVRWGLGVALNTVVPNLPLGTLAANLLGGYLIGIAVEFFSQHASLPVELRLLIITGLLGGMTTFSSFSAEAVGLLNSARYGWMALLIAAHVIGSIIMTLLGILTLRAV